MYNFRPFSCRFGADVSTKTDDAWWTPGHMAVSNGRLECLKVLIDYGIDVNAKAGPDHLSTLLHEASNGGHSDCVEALLLVGKFSFNEGRTATCVIKSLVATVALKLHV